MEHSARRSSTIRQTDSTDLGDFNNATYERVSLRVVTNGEERADASPDQLFSLFISLVAEVHRSTNDVEEGFLAGIMHRDVAVADFGSDFVGRGRSFSVRCLRFDPPDRSLALKSVLPFENFSSREEKERLGDVILELRALSHPWLRGHPNIIELLGLCWETDSADLTRKWPVLILEYADGGTLEDFLQRHPEIPFRERLTLCLDVVNGLDALHRCAVVHGDLKPVNVLVCSELTTVGHKDWTAKLADFGGSVLDVGENERGRLAMGSFPWQAPEWRSWLTREELLATDLYSLGLLIWSVMARGSEPVKTDLDIFNLPSHYDHATLEEQVFELKSRRPTQFLEYLMRAANERFAQDVDHTIIIKALSVTVVKDSNARSLEALGSLLDDALLADDKTPKSEKKGFQLQAKDGEPDLSYAPITTMAHIENILMGPDMLDTLSPTVLKYVKERLEFTYRRSETDTQKSSAAFSLAIDALRATHVPDSVDQCLNWLTWSAKAGNQSAQSLILRFHRTFHREIPLSVQSNIKEWIVHAAERNYPAAQEDLSLVLTSEECEATWRVIKSRYANIGWNRFAPQYEGMTVTLEELGYGLRDKMVNAMQSPDFNVEKFQVSSHGDNLLHFAASAGLCSVISLWNDPMPISVDNLGRWKESALLHTCRSGHFSAAMILLDLGANASLASTVGDTPLHWILSFDGTDAEQIAQRLVAAGADVNATAKDITHQWGPLCNLERGTPLHRAVGRGRIDAVQALLAVGGAANHPGQRIDKKCPIYLAAQFHYPDILDLLLKSLGTDAPAAQPYRGLSLLIAAIHGYDLYGLKFSMVSRHGEKWLSNLQGTIDVLLKHGASAHLYCFPAGLDCAGTTPLQVSIGMGSPEVVEYLLEKGCTSVVNKRTFVWTYGVEMLPLVTAIYRARKDVFDILLAHGADTSQPHLDEDGKQLSYMWQCAFAGHAGATFAEALLKRNVPVDQRHPGYETAFATAVRNRCFELAKFLLDNGADPHVEFCEGLFLESSGSATVLEFLIREQTRSALGAIDWLLREVPDMKFIVSSSKQSTALHVCASAKAWTRNEAAEGGCKLIADVLLAHFKPTKEQLNLKDVDGQTAIYCATIMSNYVIVKVLLDAGADPGIENLDGISALDANAIWLHTLSNDPDSVVDENDPRPFEKQIKRKIENRNAIRQYFEPYESSE